MAAPRQRGEPLNTLFCFRMRSSTVSTKGNVETIAMFQDISW